MLSQFGPCFKTYQKLWYVASFFNPYLLKSLHLSFHYSYIHPFLSIHSFIYLFIHSCIHTPSIHISSSSSILFIHPFLHPPIFPSIYSSSFIHLFIHSCIHPPSIHLSIIHLIHLVIIKYTNIYYWRRGIVSTHFEWKEGIDIIITNMMSVYIYTQCSVYGDPGEQPPVDFVIIHMY